MFFLHVIDLNFDLAVTVHVNCHMPFLGGGARNNGAPLSVFADHS